MPYWFGVGTSKRLYGDKQLASYNRDFNRPLFLVALSLQAINEAVTQARLSRTKPMESEEDFINRFKDLQTKWKQKEEGVATHLKSLGYAVVTATEVSRDPEFAQIISKLKNARQKFEAVDDAITKATSGIFPRGQLARQFGRMADFAFSVYSHYTMYEVAHIIYFAKKGLTKAGHAEELRYDAAAREICRYKGLRRRFGIRLPQLRFRRLRHR